MHLPCGHNRLTCLWPAMLLAGLAVGAACASQESLKPPVLTPVDPAAELGNQTPPLTMLRGSNLLYLLVADPQLPFRMILRHTGGDEEPASVLYRVVEHRGSDVVADSIEREHGADLQLQVSRPETFAVSIGGQAGKLPWYSLRVLVNHYVIDTASVAHFFRLMPPHFFYVPPGTTSFRVYAATESQAEEARLQVWTPDSRRVLDELVNASAGLERTFTVTVPEGTAGAIWSLQMGAPEKRTAGRRSENYLLQLLDIPPYLSDRRCTLLRPSP